MLVTPHEKIHTSHLNLHPTQFPYPTALPHCFALPTCAQQKLLSTFHFKILNSIFFFCHPPRVSIFCLPTDEATAKSVKNNSPTDSEKQTAIASMDNGIFFFVKAFALSNTYHVSQDPTHFSVTHFAHNGACLVCVCVCECILLKRSCVCIAQKKLLLPLYFTFAAYSLGWGIHR